MKLSAIDLNLFVVFDAIYSEGTLTSAGEIIGITQPAVSNSLSRLRNLFDDPLFVRTADGMVPTPVAQNIVRPVRQALRHIRASVQEAESFSPVDSDKQFRVSMTDLSQELLLPGLVSSVKAAAPMVGIDCYQVRRRDMNIELASGNVDLAIDIPLTPDPQIRQSKLFSHDHVCVYRRGHPIASEMLSLNRYLELDHVHVSSRRGGLGHVDLVLGKMSRRRKIAVRTQHYLITPRLVANTDMVLTAPSMLAETIRTNYDVATQDLPFEVPALETYLYWHESTDSDQANQWMRGQILQLGATFR